MAEKKTPREPCMICSHNPCDCGQAARRTKVLRDIAERRTDDAFADRLAARTQADAVILERLADDGPD